MRWDKLFDDLESQLERELTAEDIDLGAEEERLRLGRLTLRDRMVAIDEAQERGTRYELAVTLGSGTRLTIHPVTFGRDWLSADVVDESPRPRQVILPLASIAGVSLAAHVTSSLEPVVDDAHPSLSARLGLTFVLRDLCRRRRALQLELSTGTVQGTIDRVGRDHLDLAIHEPDSARRDSAVREIRLVPLSALLFVRL